MATEQTLKCDVTDAEFARDVGNRGCLRKIVSQNFAGAGGLNISLYIAVSGNQDSRPFQHRLPD